jgi:hypothetical protein
MRKSKKSKQDKQDERYVRQIEKQIAFFKAYGGGLERWRLTQSHTGRLSSARPKRKPVENQDGVKPFEEV